MLLSDYAESAEKQESGSPFYLDDGCFWVKRIGTSEYHKQIEEIKSQIYGFAPKEIDNNLVTAHWLAEYGVTNWDGVIDENEELEFSRANARRVLLNPAYSMSLNAHLLVHASDYSKYLFDQVSEDIEAAKKS